MFRKTFGDVSLANIPAAIFHIGEHIDPLFDHRPSGCLRLSLSAPGCDSGKGLRPCRRAVSHSEPLRAVRRQLDRVAYRRIEESGWELFRDFGGRPLDCLVDRSLDELRVLASDPRSNPRYCPIDNLDECRTEDLRTNLVRNPGNAKK